jgi:uncharacterized protein YdhG (YjbR/CyaY superfamily)
MSAIDDYLARISEPQKAELERMRKIVNRMVPDAQEVISYGIPAFKYKNKYLVGFAAYKDHMSLFPTPEPIEFMKDKLSRFQLSKGTIQFARDNPLPEPIIKELLRLRIAAIDKK